MWACQRRPARHLSARARNNCASIHVLHPLARPGTINSKPDSIYALIRQVLDAKKRAHHQPAAHDDQHHYLRPYHGALAGSQMMNLSTGNLALANQNGKSVSTSALGRPETSVDRWSVVMDLLAQTRFKEAPGGEPADSGTLSSGKRHSKQLDKFKLAAKSAAAASKHQRHYIQQQQAQGNPTDGPQLSAVSQQYAGVHLGSAAPAAEPAAYLVSNPAAGQLARQAAAPVAGPQSAPTSSGPGDQQQQQQTANMLVHHTQSMPVGKLAPVGAHQQQAAERGPYEGPIGLGGHTAPGDVAGAGGHMQQTIANYQLLNIGAQQLQSTSGECVRPMRASVRGRP